MKGALVLALAAALSAALSLATAAPAAAPTFAKTEGAGETAPCTVVPPLSGTQFCFTRGRSFAFEAMARGGGPIVRGLGARATGFYAHSSVGLTPVLRGDVTCLNVVGNTAVFGGVLRRIANETGPRIPFVVYVVDNGEANEGDPPDLISPLSVFPENDPDRPLLPEAFPHLCPPPAPSIYGYLPVTDGNIVVQEGEISLTP